MYEYDKCHNSRTDPFTGEVQPGPKSNKWFNTWAECQGVQRRVSTSDGTFALPGITVNQWGENVLDVTVRDVSGNTAQQRRTVVKGVTNALEGFRYDGNGNLTNWFSGSNNWVYEWDWADRMTKVSSNGVVVLENYYDAGSHRIGKAEVSGTTTTRFVYLYDGWDIIGLCQSGGNLYETYTRGVALAGDIGGLVGVARHNTNQKYYLHNNHRGDITHVRMNAFTLSTHRYTAFGQMIGTTAGVSRFKFSSKERDASTGMMYYGYRFYAPMWQRWVSRDPVGEHGGLNLHGFAHNNSQGYVDSDGRSIVPLIVLFVGGWHTWCAIRGIDKASEKFHEPGQDRERHCMVSCLHNRCTLLGSPAINILGNIILDLVATEPEIADQAAGLYGTAASYNLFKSCEDSCKKCPYKR